MVRLLLLVAVVLISLAPVKLAAVIVGAKRTSFAWCFLATVVAGILQLLGMGLPGPGNLVAVLLAGAGYSAILRTSYAGGLAIVILQVIIAVGMFIGVSMLFGLMHGMPSVGPVVL